MNHIEAVKEIRILVMERGFVLIGQVSQDNDYLFYNVDRCHVVRRWGTQTGLGQLANNHGPLASTILDFEGDGVRVLKTAVYRSIPTNWGSV